MIQDDYLQEHCNLLDMLHKDMSERCEDHLSLEMPDWVINPFSRVRNAEATTWQLEQELI